MSTLTHISSYSMFRRALGVLAIASLGLVGATSTAQAGIDIRAPFTHVGVDRHDGINVAAPFTRVNVGGHRHHDDRRGYYNDRRDYRDHRGYDRYHDHDRGFFGRW